MNSSKSFVAAGNSPQSDSESERDQISEPVAPKKPAPVKALEALAKARQARKEKAEAAKKEKEEIKKKKEEAVKIVSSLRKPKEPMPSPIDIPVIKDSQPSQAELLNMIAKLNEKLEKKPKKKVIIESDSSSSEEEVIIKKPKRKPIVPAVDPEFEQWKAEREKRQMEEASKQKEMQMKLDLKKLFSRY